MQTNSYSFTAASNDVIYLTVLKTNGPGNYPYLYLSDPAGTVIAAGNANSILTYVANFRLTKTGTYTVGVVDDGLDESFDYSITFNLVKGGVNQREAGEGPETLLPGQSSYGHISPGDYDSFTFTASSNDVIYLTVLKTNGPGNYPYLYLSDPAGTVIAAGNANSILTYVANFRLTKTGTYTVGVVDDGLDESFDYSITFNLVKGGVNQREADEGPETLLPGQSSYGHMSPGDYDSFTFTASSNDVIKIPGPNFPEAGEGAELILPGDMRAAQIAPGEFDGYTFPVIAGEDVSITLSRTFGAGVPVLQLFGPGGVLLATDSGSASAQIRIRCSPQYGPFTIVCYESGFDEAFTYNLRLVQTPGPPPSYDPAHPYLAEFRCETNVVTRWPTNAAGFQLQFSQELCATNVAGQCYGSWTNVPPPYAVIGDHYFVTNRSSAPYRFYRLANPGF